jgi:hypothetical protein
MSNDDKEADYYIDWIEKSISEGNIKYYEYLEFEKKQKIGSGTHGKVIRANMKNTDRFFALKSFNNDKITLKEVVSEV